MENVVMKVLMLATGKDESKVQELKVNRYKLRMEDFRCYKKLIAAFSENCFKLSDVSSQKLNLLMFSMYYYYHNRHHPATAPATTTTEAALSYDC
jgi:hypothetical protein